MEIKVKINDIDYCVEKEDAIYLLHLNLKLIKKG